MKVLHITVQDFIKDIKTGGQQVAERNNNLIKKVIGNQNIYLLMFTKEKYEAHEADKEGVYFLPLVNNSLENILVGFQGYRRFNPRWRRKIKKIIKKIDPDVVFLDTSELGRIIRWLKKDTKCIVFFHNIEIDYVWNNKIKRKKYYAFPILIATYLNEHLCVKKADKIICLNERDNKRLQKMYCRAADLVLPVGFYDKFDESKLKKNVKARELIFIGSNFPPNYQGIKWFVENVMPKLEGFRLTIVGRGFENVRKKLERENVEVVGTVDDLEKYYYTYCCVVMPILYGNGMKVKTAEAMMYGMNIFATDEALEGYDVDGIDGIYRCNSVDEFVMTIEKAYSENNIYECAKQVRCKYLAEYKTDNQIEKIKELMDSI